MLARVTTFALHGLDSRRITVEVDVRQGLPAFTVVGLGDRSVRESRERVRGAILNSGLEFPSRRLTVNLAPAHLRKEGPGFDLAIACAVLAASSQVPADVLERTAVFGELDLHGELRPASGALAVAEGALRHGLEHLIVPAELVGEASLVEGIGVHGVRTLRDVVAVLHGDDSASVLAPAPLELALTLDRRDLADVRGQLHAIRALTIAAAGGHNLLLSGPPGTGKTMLAQRLPSILPPLSRPEAIEVTRIYSVCGRHRGGGLITRRPFRSPHHKISASGLVGGGSVPTPGEVTLAHNGVLFLDELAEFSRSSLEALRQPVEDGSVAIVRSQRTAIYPSRFMLIASTNPCPCGMAGTRRCECTDADVARYRRRLSGPLLDRLDLLVYVQRPEGSELQGPPSTSSAAQRELVVAARERQAGRLRDATIALNAHMDSALIREHVVLDAGTEAFLQRFYDSGTLSPRGHQRVLRVARTIADLDGAERVARAHVVEALSLRQDVEGQSDRVAA